jgi:hypothetical protein
MHFDYECCGIKTAKKTHAPKLLSMLCQVCQDTYLAGREKVSSSPAFSLCMSVELKLTLRTRLPGTNWKTMQKAKDVRDRNEMDEVKAKWFPTSDPS